MDGSRTCAREGCPALLPVFAVAEPERTARLRELRLASLLLLGRRHTLTQAVAAALIDPAAVVGALDELDALPALPRRRLLATIAAILPTESRAHAMVEPA
jgi:hypothetical protein